jgi:hypothetical protein
MRFTPARCPDCRKPWVKIDEDIIGCTAEIARGEDGGYDYSGDTYVNWDGQETREDDFGFVTVMCEEGHYHYEVICYGDDEKRPRVKGRKPRPGTVAALSAALKRLMAAPALNLDDLETEDVRALEQARAALPPEAK